MPTSTVQLHKAIIRMCLAIEKLADAIETPVDTTSVANARHARELVDQAHRALNEEPGRPWPGIEEETNCG